MAAAPEWRFDPLTGRRVLISPDRGERPIRAAGECPFCAGHEAETPPEVLAYREPNSAPNGPGWRVRVVPNRYAAVQMDLAIDHGDRSLILPMRPAGSETSRHGSAPGLGVAEVFLECPQHETAFRNLSPTHVADVLRAWRDRLRFWRDDGRLAFAQVFRNEGPAAGASVEHCHSQLIGLPFVPPAVDEELRLAGPGCVFCGWLAAEAGGALFVTESAGFAVLCPPAPRFPGETWVLPKAHAPAFETLTDLELGALADVLRDLVGRIDRSFGRPDFNLIVKSAPFRPAGPFHWRIEALPRTISAAGWEWGTGVVITTMFPEQAADMLRRSRA
jgi:UDPglucose--hexose-1-phosphate uridylyltransferase